MIDLDIRPASPRDATDIAEVHIGSFLATYPDLPTTRRSAENGLEGRVALWDRRIRLPETGRSTLVATADGRVCGFVHLGPTPDRDDGADTGHVYSIHVSPELTGHGVGGRLMTEATASLRAAGYRTATLWVVADNDSACRFYQQLGWAEEAVRRRETLAAGDEEGDEVEVVRYRRDLGEEA